MRLEDRVAMVSENRRRERSRRLDQCVDNSNPAIASVRISAKERLARAAAMNRRRRRHDTLFLAHILTASSGLFFELSETLIAVQLVLMIVIFMAFAALCLTEQPIDL